MLSKIQETDGENMKVKVALLVVWAIVGLLVLFGKKQPSKWDYGVVWFCLLLQIVGGMIKEL